ncbi:unnamed protein product [Spirodela intermedia]|uniref:Uncharacterized protein n=1 Tax=Spirodela intermedia TaxID=51605 RepID=A0A7I8IJR7_SPIIN|nr:unnamed protein product [Spirodela intermedia]CAA6658126.1 unnamed protein product [Spirodela intermedia]
MIKGGTASLVPNVVTHSILIGNASKAGELEELCFPQGYVARRVPS